MSSNEEVTVTPMPTELTSSAPSMSPTPLLFPLPKYTAKLLRMTHTLRNLWHIFGCWLIHHLRLILILT